jgi:hypothetical protein
MIDTITKDISKREGVGTKIWKDDGLKEIG